MKSFYHGCIWIGQQNKVQWLNYITDRNSVPTTLKCDRKDMVLTYNLYVETSYLMNVAWYISVI